MRDVSTNWRDILAAGFKSAAELLTYLELPLDLSSSAAEQEFATRVPRNFAARMQKGNACDPLLLQVLAAPAELVVTDGFSVDPVGERAVNPLPGLIHKYAGRVLLTVAGACAINCRYCFRRHFAYADNNPGRVGWQSALDYIAADNSIHEVILSGGEPLLAADVLLQQLINGLDAIAHVNTVRIHTRIPVVLPERIDASLLSILTNTRLQCVVVIHTNHAQELSAEVQAACQRLTASGCYLLSQSVLLAGINDTVEILAALSRRLFTCGVLPYYLHCLDPVQGAAHFQLSDTRAIELLHGLQQSLPGYLVPRLVREQAGAVSKRLVVA
jgi:EF-P beta-lysylation protein EpmB